MQRKWAAAGKYFASTYCIKKPRVISWLFYFYKTTTNFIKSYNYKNAYDLYVLRLLMLKLLLNIRVYFFVMMFIFYSSANKSTAYIQ